MTKHALKLVGSLVAISLLSACGSGGGSSGSGSPNNNGVPSATPLNEPVETGAVSADSDGQIQIESTDITWKDFNTISIGGNDFVYDPQTDRFVGVDEPEIYLTLVGTGEHAKIAIFTDETGGSLNAMGGTLIGDVTEIDQMPTEATASYSGGLTMWVTVDGQDGFTSHIGSAEINADFGTQTVDGGFSFDGKDIAMEGAVIQDDFFGGLGVLSSDTADYAIDNSLIRGNFYGDTAQEVGGALGYSYNDATSGEPISGSAVGVFHGSQ